jgi:hypothetical protein
MPTGRNRRNRKAGIVNMTKPMPAIFFGHGNPMNALRDRTSRSFITGIWERMPCWPHRHRITICPCSI